MYPLETGISIMSIKQGITESELQDIRKAQKIFVEDGVFKVGDAKTRFSMPEGFSIVEEGKTQVGDQLLCMRIDGPTYWSPIHRNEIGADYTSFYGVIRKV